MSQRTRVGVVGCGDIARKAYLPFIRGREECSIVACADTRGDIAAALATDFDIPTVHTLEEMLADKGVDAILNLTHPAAHASVNLASLEHGKHVVCEKPFALTREEGQAVLAKSKETGLLIASAPDTVLGPGTQAARQALDSGLIGQPVGGRITWTCGGHESWHPNPAFYYQHGGGPMLDMGPYYLSALVHLLGPIRSVLGRTSRAHETRTITSEPLNGTKVPVEVSTHYSGVIEMASGVHVLTLMSFDVPGAPDFGQHPEIMGTKGTLISPDPNAFDGGVRYRLDNGGWRTVESKFDYPAGRGLGLIDLVQAAHAGTTPRASGELAYHVLDAMLAFEDSERTGRRVDLESTCERPAAVGEHGL
jgi:predicted dehydrogenase